jgi:hypothetical protein
MERPMEASGAAAGEEEESVALKKILRTLQSLLQRTARSAPNVGFAAASLACKISEQNLSPPFPAFTPPIP